MPSQATWDASEKEWVLGPVDPSGQQIGTWLAWDSRGQRIWIARYSAHSPGALNGDVEYVRRDGTLAKVEHWSEGYKLNETIVESAVVPEWLTASVESVIGALCVETPSEMAAPDRSVMQGLARAHLARGAETPIQSMDRLMRFLAAAKAAEWADVPKLERGSPFTAAQLGEYFAPALPRSFVDLLTSVGSFVVASPHLSVRIPATVEQLDFDASVGLLHTSSSYADLYGVARKGFSADHARSAFLRVVAARYFFSDEAEHEDGDVALLVLDRSAPRSEPPVWELPHDDGYEHKICAASAGALLSWLVDRVVRCAYLHASGIYAEYDRQDWLAGNVEPSLFEL